MSRPTRRIIVGAVSGLVGGFGATIILAQGGSVPFRTSWAWALPIGMGALGAVLAAFAHITWLRRVGRGLIALYVVGAFVAAFTPAYSQGECPFTAEADAETMYDGHVRPPWEPVCLSATDATVPWIVDVSNVEYITVYAEPDIIPRDHARIVLNSVPGLGSVPGVGDTVIWQGPSHDLYEAISIDLQVDSLGLVTFQASGSTVTLPAVGVYGIILETADGEFVDSAFVQLVTSPFTNLIGIGGGVAVLLGSLGMLLAGAAPRRPLEPPRETLPLPTEALDADWIPAVDAPHAAYVETRFVDSATGERVSHQRPLLQDHEYGLEISINPSVDEKDEERPSQAVRPLTIVPRSHDFDVGATVTLGISGTPLQITIPVTPRRSSSPAQLRLDVFSDGSLLQSERVSADLVTSPSDSRGSQSTRTVFSASDFSTADLAARGPRAVTLIVELDEKDQSVDCRLVDGSREAVAVFDTRLQTAALVAATRNLRGRLIEMLSGSIAGVPGYRDSVDGATEQLDAWLPHLADGGRDLFRALFPELGRVDAPEALDLASTVAADTIIQVNQSYAGIGAATVPWGFLYDRPVVTDASSRVCCSYRTHGPADCPHGGSPEVVCPWGFWGYRYVIEQPPSWVGEKLPPPTVHRLENDHPLVVSFTVDPSLDLWEDHLARLSAEAELDVLLAKGYADLRSHWAANGDRIDLVYFYCHHGQDPDGGGSWLRVGTDEISTNDIEAITPTNAWSDRPLVFLNGCATGDYAVESYESFINEFRRAGAAGVIGTECKVREFMAEEYARALFPNVFAGQAVGTAMLELRRSFLADRASAAAFLYSLYAPGDIVLATPVAGITPSEPVVGRGFDRGTTGGDRG